MISTNGLRLMWICTCMCRVKWAVHRHAQWLVAANVFQVKQNQFFIFTHRGIVHMICIWICSIPRRWMTVLMPFGGVSFWPSLWFATMLAYRSSIEVYVFHLVRLKPNVFQFVFLWMTFTFSFLLKESMSIDESLVLFNTPMIVCVMRDNEVYSCISVALNLAAIVLINKLSFLMVILMPSRPNKSNLVSIKRIHECLQNRKYYVFCNLLAAVSNYTETWRDCFDPQFRY